MTFCKYLPQLYATPFHTSTQMEVDRRYVTYSLVYFHLASNLLIRLSLPETHSIHQGQYNMTLEESSHNRSPDHPVNKPSIRRFTPQSSNSNPSLSFFNAALPALQPTSPTVQPSSPNALPCICHLINPENGHSPNCTRCKPSVTISPIALCESAAHSSPRHLSLPLCKRSTEYLNRVTGGRVEKTKDRKVIKERDRRGDSKRLISELEEFLIADGWTGTIQQNSNNGKKAKLKYNKNEILTQVNAVIRRQKKDLNALKEEDADLRQENAGLKEENMKLKQLLVQLQKEMENAAEYLTPPCSKPSSPTTSSFSARL
ncbi:hypothetical protein M501DRAFT_606808 [Patellaria atrata CBS 101060]|uniref:Uncharacterized protein n=1 Tax=Patellaria atrata CBS 101060 TaxID=1346257 RepID=A0A9P4SDE0_9PEZI|nr:hypothetical protein M501DRAFT_606808 [Patellaria atrata CBS 101060]